MFQISVPGGLFGSGGFDPLALQRQAEERGRAEREYQAAEAARLAALKAEVEERNRRQAEADAAKAAQVQPANISTYYDALRAGEDPSEFADILQSSLSDQGYITSGADMAEAGAYAPVEDLFIVPGGIDTSNVGEFKFDKTLEDFEGYAFDYGNISNENLKKFQEELMPVMAPEVAQAQLEGQSYQNALIQAYERSPQVQEIYAKYDISPQRISRNNASEYVYDPFTFGEIQTVDRSKGFMDYVGDVVEAGLPAIAGAGLFGPIAGSISSGLGAPAALQPALTGALTGAATAAVTGGDPLTAALTGGLGGFADPLITGANLGTFGTAGARGLSSAAIAELTGGDPLQAGLLAAGMSLGKDALEALKTNDAVTAPAGETTEESSVVDKAKETVEGVKETVEEVRDTITGAKETVTDTVTDFLEPTDAQTPRYDALDRAVGHLEELGYSSTDALKRLNSMSNDSLENLLIGFGDTAGLEAFGFDGVRNTAFDPSRPNILAQEISEVFGGITTTDMSGQQRQVVEDYLRRSGADAYKSDILPDVYRPETNAIVNVEALTEPKIERPVVPTQPGGGGGASSAAAPSAPATTVTAPAAPSATITPVVQPPTLTSPGSVTNALLTNTLATLASTTTPTTAPQPTVAPPVTPVATTAPTPDPIPIPEPIGVEPPVEAVEPTDIFTDTVDTTPFGEADLTTAREEGFAEGQEGLTQAQENLATAQQETQEAKAKAEQAVAAREKAEQEAEAARQQSAQAEQDRQAALEKAAQDRTAASQAQAKAAEAEAARARIEEQAAADRATAAKETEARQEAERQASEAKAREAEAKANAAKEVEARTKAEQERTRIEQEAAEYRKTATETSNKLSETLESTKADLAEQRDVTEALQSDIDGLNEAVTGLKGTVESLQGKLSEAQEAKEAAVQQGNDRLVESITKYEGMLRQEIEQSQKTLADAVEAGNTKVDEAVAAGKTAVDEAVAAGKALGEAKYGEGLGTGRGQGAGAGIGAGLGLGLLAGMGGGAGGGVGTGFTPKDFEDYKFRKTYEAPELLERTLPLQGYQAPVSLNLFRGFV